MCGRFTLTDPDPARIRARFGLDESAKLEEEPRYNIAPTDPVLAIRRDEHGEREPGRLRWGLIPGRWAERRSGPPLINARAETLEQPARLRRVVPRAPLPDPGRRLLRVAGRRVAGSRRSGSAAPTASCSPSPASGPRCPRARRRRCPAQLRDRHLRAERADSPDPRPDAGRPDARCRGAVARAGRRGGGAARLCWCRRRRTCSLLARSSMRSTTSARTAPTCSTRARRSRSCSS